MADLGAIGTKSRIGEKGSSRFPYGGLYLHGVMVIGRMVHFTSAVRDDVEGNPGPSQRVTGSGMLGYQDGQVMYWYIAGEGLRSFQIDVKFTPNTAPRPRIIAKANPDVGLMADLMVEAVSGTGWQTLLAQFTATKAPGIVEVYREMPSGYMDAVTYWDNLRTG